MYVCMCAWRHRSEQYLVCQKVLHEDVAGGAEPGFTLLQPDLKEDGEEEEEETHHNITTVFPRINIELVACLLRW